MPRYVTSILAMVGAGALVLAACSSDRDAFPDRPGFGSDAGADSEAPECGFRCSRDLKKVLKGCSEADGELIAECGVGQGCGIDRCVDACTSAALSRGSVGCSFYAVPPDDGYYGAGGCYASMVANTWDVPVHLTAEYGGEPLDISRSIYVVERSPSEEPTYAPLSGPLEPGQVAVIFLAQAEAPTGEDPIFCPPGTTAALKADPIRHGTTKTKAFRLVADAPVAAYAIFPYGGAASYYPTATLLLPVSSWDQSYVAIATGKFGDPDTSSLDRRTLQIIGQEDETKVAMRPTVDIAPGEDVVPGVTGEVVEWTIGKGEVLQITQESSPTGSAIVASKPIGLFGGSPCTFLPSGKAFCDLTQQQIAPFAQWGTSYALVPFRPRTVVVTGTARETVPWMLVGAVDGTVLTYDPAKPPGAPASLAAGEVAAFETDALVTVRSQDSKHPFHASVHMTGSTYGGGAPGGNRTLGDPEFVGVAPSDQFLDRYVFFTDFTYPETSLTLVRRKTETGFKSVVLGCAGEVTGWQPLGEAGEFEYTWVQLTSAFEPQAFGAGTCGYGRHEAASEGPFSVTVWGIGKDASYGYVGGMGSRPINDAPPPSVR